MNIKYVESNSHWGYFKVPITNNPELLERVVLGVGHLEYEDGTELTQQEVCTLKLNLLNAS